MRKEFEMTHEQFQAIADACRPPPLIFGSAGKPLFGDQQSNANAAWRALGDELGFDGMSVRPVSGKGPRFFTAEVAPNAMLSGEPRSGESAVATCSASADGGKTCE